MKEAIHALKYDRLHPAAHPLGIMLAQAIAQLADEAPIDLLVVPIPLHKSKHAERGFNQARSLAVHALQSLAKTHPQWRLTLASSTLMRTRATESQAGLAPRMRRINLRGAFAVSHPAAVAKKNILLVDDILTTGATARAAAKALHQAGAADIWVATLARAGRVHAPGRKSTLQYDDTDEQSSNPLAGTVPAAVLQAASRHSSHGQSSF
jgi:ComF family protein